MTVLRDIRIVQGQTWNHLFSHTGLVSSGRGLRMHIRSRLGNPLIQTALTHDGDANARVSFVSGGVQADLGATISNGWDLGSVATRRWVYSLESYSLSDPDDVLVLDSGSVYITVTAADESSINPDLPFPSYDLACVRFDLVQSLSDEQKERARDNIGAGTGTGGGIALGTGTNLELVTVDTAGTSLGRGGYTVADLLTAARARADHSGTQLASTISDFVSAAISAVPWSSMEGKPSTFAPSAHAASHATAGSDAITPASIGAEATGVAASAVAAHAGAVDPHGDRNYTDTQLASYQVTSAKGQNNGYASLDSSGKIPQSQIPSIAITEFLNTAANEAAMLALIGQQGDWCVRTDLGTTWVITGSDPTLLANWTQIVTPASPVSSVAGRTGAVTLSASDISGLAAVATTGAYANLSGTPSLGTAAAQNVEYFATAAQGNAADNAVQDVAAEIAAATDKAIPVDADLFGIADSAAANALKKLSWANIKATAKAYFDTFYAVINHRTTHAVGGSSELEGLSSVQMPNATIVTESGTTRTIADSDAGKVIRCTHASGCIVTFPDTLTAGKSFVLLQATGAGPIEWAVSGSMVATPSGADRAAHTESNGVGSVITAFVDAANSVIIGGDTI